MIKKLAYIFLFCVILFSLYQVSIYNNTLELIFNNADIKTVKNQAIIDNN